MTVYTLDPIYDPRWAEFINRHPSSSVFHSVPWLQAIRQTYGYKPVVYTTSPPSAPLSDGIALCQVKSWLTGHRMVSLPFSDHCEPLVDNSYALSAIAHELRNKVGTSKWKYVEIRPVSEHLALNGAAAAPLCYLHMLDLRPEVADILHKTHKTSIQQAIKRAEREGIALERGDSERLLAAFYRLMLKTRQRHGLPPQPIEWFRNLGACFGRQLQIRVAFRDGRPIAGILTLRYKDALIHKYGCSDDTFKNLGATPLLIWNAIVEAKLSGATSMDFGRSEADNQGLITFKNRWGAKAQPLVYKQWSRKQARVETGRRPPSFAKRLFAVMPDFALKATGHILYRHVG